MIIQPTDQMDMILVVSGAFKARQWDVLVWINDPNRVSFKKTVCYELNQ